MVLRAVVELSGSARFHCLGPSVVSGDLERMSQCTSRPNDHDFVVVVGQRLDRLLLHGREPGQRKKREMRMARRDDPERLGRGEVSSNVDGHAGRCPRLR